MDGWKDGRLKDKYKVIRFFLEDFQKLQSHFLACSLVMNELCCF